MLLEHVRIPGYIPQFRNRQGCRGGGVGVYIKESAKNKRRKDIENLEPELESLWLEISGRNKNSNLLFGVVYRSNRLLEKSEWKDKTESVLSHNVSQWNGLLVATGDINIDLWKGEELLQRQYTGMLKALNLHQHVSKPTRTTKNSSTLIDHIISNSPPRVTFTDVLPCSHISDHDVPYACINIRVNRYEPQKRYFLLHHAEVILLLAVQPYSFYR